MIKLDTSRMPARVVAGLMARGAQLPPLQWFENPSRQAKQTLDQVSNDTELLGCEELADPKAAAAVRALLYFWNGWPEEAEMYSVVASEREQAYITALCKRQAGHADAAKTLFQTVGVHPVFTPLAEFAKDRIGRTSLTMLKRLRDMIAFGDAWEPFIFADAFEQALNSNLDVAGDMIMRQLQCYEFELLIGYCVDSATGEKLSKYQGDTVRQDAAKRPPARPPARRPAQPAPPAPRPKSEPKAGEGEKKAPPRPINPTDVGVLCPKCQAALSFPESARGATGRCEKCGATFLIPQRAAPASSPES
jgi:hypothetical protein